MAFGLTVEDYIAIAKGDKRPLLKIMDKDQIKEKIISEKGQEYFDNLGSQGCPTDPFERVMCTSCQ